MGHFTVDLVRLTKSAVIMSKTFKVWYIIVYASGNEFPLTYCTKNKIFVMMFEHKEIFLIQIKSKFQRSKKV